MKTCRWFATCGVSCQYVFRYISNRVVVVVSFFSFPLVYFYSVVVEFFYSSSANNLFVFFWTILIKHFFRLSFQQTFWRNVNACNQQLRKYHRRSHEFHHQMAQFSLISDRSVKHGNALPVWQPSLKSQQPNKKNFIQTFEHIHSENKEEEEKVYVDWFWHMLRTNKHTTVTTNSSPKPKVNNTAYTFSQSCKYERKKNQR